MDLQGQLDAKKHELENAIPKDALDVMHQATEELRRPEVMSRVKTVGDSAPDFTLNNYAGQPVSLEQRLSEGPVVLGFYRGRW